MKKNLSLAACTLAAGVLTLGLPAFAQTTGSTSQGSTGSSSSSMSSTHSQSTQHGSAHGTMSSQDHKFAMDAAQGGMAEVELGRLAAQKASNADVKAFGQRMVDDHSKANAQLMQAATSAGMTPPKTLDAKHRQDMDKLSRLSGTAFDREYMSHMLMDHKKDVAEFEKQSEKGTDASLRTFATQTLPTLREHLRMAQEIATKVGASNANAASHSGH
jgi:putative membrane protein